MNSVYAASVFQVITDYTKVGVQMSDVFDRLPDIQRRYINREMFNNALSLIRKYPNDFDKIAESNESLRRYCKLALRYL